MTNKIYSLLVGIDSYAPQSNVSPLRGCVNDINAMEAYLQERIAKDRNSQFQLIEPLKLANEKATRQGIIDGFKNYLSQADSEDVVLFYYSGHGAYEPAPKEFWQEEPDHLNETLVCYDSRMPNSRDLADKELRYLISKVAKNNPHIVVILDCCHSGTGTRNIPQGSRRAPEETRFRSWDSFVFAEELFRSRSGLEKVSIPQGKHILLAACRDYQEAKEYQTETGEYRGIFSYFLLQTLQHDNGTLNYRDLVKNTNAIVSGKINNQSPQVEAISSEKLQESKELLEQSFLGGAVPRRPPHFTLSYSHNYKSWVIDGGALHGIPQSSGDEQTVLAIFAPGTDGEELTNLDGAFGEARVTQVLSQLSLVKIELGEDIVNEDFSYDAVVVSLPIEKLKVCIKGEEEGVKLAVAQLQPSLYVEQVEAEESADYYLEAKSGQYWIKLAMESDRPQVAPIPRNAAEAGYTEKRAELTVKRLEHIARWKNTLELKSPAACRIKPSDIKLEIVKVAADGSDMYATAAAEIALEYDRYYDSWEPARYYLRLTNQSNQTLYCNVLNLALSYGVTLPYFTEGSSVRLQPGQIINGEYIDAYIPDELWEGGVSELQDRLKLIVSTLEFDASLLEQEDIEVMAPTRDLPPAESDPRFQNSLNRLLVRHQHKHARPSTRGRSNDWLTKEVILTIIRPQGALDVSSQRSISLGHGVEVLPHPTLEAKASLTTAEETARNINAVLPSILREKLGVIEPVRFSSNSRGVNGELSALELFDVVDYQVVTPEAPLKVRLDAELKSGENLLAVGFDGEFFLPLGRLVATGNDTEISLERLPQPTSSGRSLHGSIRIFFQKVISQELGLTFDSYPILAAATVDAEGKVTYEKNPELVASKVAAAEKILLYVHGIIGDTKMMAGSAQRVMLEIDGVEKPLGGVYDLVLTFDYENLNTTIEENARLLGEKLKAAGLASKQLDVVAHSMGGLICRWFIEKEGGDRFVKSLVMVGTPNAGSPWATIQDWALASLGFALNQVSSVFWPAEMVAKLLEFMEEKERSLDQMKPNSDLLRELGKASGSSVAYTIIAGDRSLVPEALESQVLERLAERLFAGTLDLAFFGQPNDLAATVASMKAVEKEEKSEAIIVACDHFSYFSSEAGLTALAKALKQSPSQPKNLPVKDNKKWLIGGVVLAVVVAIAGVIWWNVSQQQQEQLPEKSVSLLVPREPVKYS